jgi:hypothetical protein
MICVAIAIITWTLSMAETLREARDQFDNDREFSQAGTPDTPFRFSLKRVRSHRQPYRRCHGRREADRGGRGKRRASAARQTSGLRRAAAAMRKRRDRARRSPPFAGKPG